MSKRIAGLVGAFICGLAMSQAQAAPIWVDFGEFSDDPNTNPASSDPVWNIIRTGSAPSTNLVDAAGAPSGVTLAFGTGLWKTWLTPSTGQAGNTPSEFLPGSDDFLFLSAGEQAQITLTGLSNPGGYQLEWVASRATPAPAPGSRASNYTVTGASAPETISGFDATADGFLDGDILQWTLPSAIGTTTLTAGGQGLGAAYVNALRITPLDDVTPVSEPGVLPLTLVGMILLIVAVRLRKVVLRPSAAGEQSPFQAA